MIAPGGLLLVVPMYVQFRSQFYWWGCQIKNKKKLNLDILFYYPEWHIEHRWRCSNLPLVANGLLSTCSSSWIFIPNFSPTSNLMQHWGACTAVAAELGCALTPFHLETRTVPSCTSLYYWEENQTKQQTNKIKQWINQKLDNYRGCW
jgi:hypothetical protein